MLWFIAKLGGLLLMMGHHTRGESLFCYFRLEDRVPENHLLRLIDRNVSLDFIRAKLKNCYSDTGRPSIDPELLLRMLLIGYLYGVTSERKLVEELRIAAETSARSPGPVPSLWLHAGFLHREVLHPYPAVRFAASHPR